MRFQGTMGVVGAVGALVAAGAAAAQQASMEWTLIGPDPAKGRALCMAARPSFPHTLAIGAMAQGAGVTFGLPEGAVPEGDVRGTVQVGEAPETPVTFSVNKGGANLFNPPMEFWTQMDAARSVRTRINGVARDYDMAGYRQAMHQVMECAQGLRQASTPVSPPAAPLRPGGELNLVCTGTANYTVDERTNLYAYSGGQSASGWATTTRGASSREEFTFRVAGNDIRVRPPRIMIPLMRGKGLGDGWWPLSDAQVDDARIGGKWSFNPLNNPRAVIDRRTGEATVSGFGFSFRGTCEAVSYDPEARKF